MGTDVIKFYSGTSGLVLPVANKQAFPPEFRDKSRLTYYASLFNSLEVNSSFYKVPMATTTKRWASEVPDDFRFTFKLFREITHNKALAFDNTLVEKFMHVIDQVGNKKGALLVQFPASITYDNLSQLKKILTSIRKFDKANDWDLCVEFRNVSWYRVETYKLLERYRAAMVIHDMPASAPPLIDSWTDFEYVRFHGPAGDYKGGYTDELLKEYAGKMEYWLKKEKTVYTYFNNTIGGAITNLMTMNTIMHQQ
ncbi:DUF72 domain-containing protein [Chitinophaga sp. S165]|uniref:DUF72 domain-containing protein n=1 Tax=Chitinophaga sp. S165 TaxID=2135462 RepID=UPI000D71A027|nr:DUF72 domain-containing protein [Chitinophaga sp. S165]PWV49596.1 uncharacterized protein YecE (DUF72 family) [Chitinophaga sp. S165]